MPWLGFFNKARLSDLLVIGDHVQYRNKGYQNRNKIKTTKGAQWLTIPIVHNWGQAIKDVGINETEQNGVSWDELHLRTLQVNYGKAPFYDKYIGIFEKIYRRRIKLLADNNLEFLKAIFEILGINVPIKKTSEMTLSKAKTELIVEICKTVGADAYISGMGGSQYMEESLFEQNGLKLLFNNYEHPVYNQQFMNSGFLPNMSIIDLIFNHGPESLEITKSGFKGFELNSIRA
ncbi:MAG TPA: WbqC family protein, partial [Candidatus Bathyarchaeia archaeon]|nr:WbqC family protein [Candidatus Bathyarchaeia archaeon]